MKKIEFDYKFLIFLYAYLRQINLSLDRSRWEGLSGLRLYYENQIQPSRLMKYFTDRVGPVEEVKFPLYFFEDISFFKKRWSALLSYFIYQKHFLTYEKIIYCFELLRDFEKVLISKFNDYTLEVEKLRVDITSFNNNTIESNILERDVSKAMSVEHYLQHKEMTPITKFMNDIDL